jgi:hypothetical protein
VQEGMIGDTDIDSGEVLVTVVAAMTGLWCVYGGLVHKYPSDSELIEPYFNIELLRKLPQMEWDRTVAESAEEFVFKRTLDPKRKFKLTVFTKEPVDFYIADEKNDPERTKKITVQGEEEEIVEWQQLAETSTATYFKIKNISALVPAHVKIEILPEGS